MMIKKEFPLDRSAAFTALLENSTVFAKMDMNAGSEVISQFLADWYASPDLDMWAFGREWVAQWERDTLTEGE